MKRVLFACALMAAGASALAADPPPAPSLPASLPVRRDAPSDGGAHGWAPSLALALLAGVGGAWAWRRRSSRSRGQAARPDALVRLANLALTPHASVHAVQWRGEEWLLACTSQQVTLLSRRAVDAGKREGA